MRHLARFFARNSEYATAARCDGFGKLLRASPLPIYRPTNLDNDSLRAGSGMRRYFSFLTQEWSGTSFGIVKRTPCAPLEPTFSSDLIDSLPADLRPAWLMPFSLDLFSFTVMLLAAREAR